MKTLSDKEKGIAWEAFTNLLDKTPSINPPSAKERILRKLCEKLSRKA